MDATHYIWALWQTRTGKVLISIFVCIVVARALIQVFGWWLIPIALAFIFLIWLSLYLDKREREKRQFKESHPTVNIVHNWIKPTIIPTTFYLVIGSTGDRVIEIDNNIFKIAFAISPDFCSIIVNLTNTSNQSIDVDWKSATINSDNVYIDGIIYSNYHQSGVLPPRSSISKSLLPCKNYVKGKFIRLFLVGAMMKREVRYDFTICITEKDKKEKKSFIYNLYTRHK